MRLILFFLFGISIQLSAFAQQQVCQSPEGNGECVFTQDCKPFTDYVQRFRSARQPIPQEVKKRLRNYLCEDGKFCCPTKERSAMLGQSGAALLPNDCGNSDAADKLFGGTIAALGEFPWTALLGYVQNNIISYRCGAALINDRYVITAAHCVNQYLTFVRLGEHNITSNPDCQIFYDGTTDCMPPIQDIFIDDIIINERYNNGTMQHDIALLRLRTSADLTADNVKAICLPLANELRNKKLRSLVVTGWGITELQMSSDVLRLIKVRVESVDVCRAAYPNSMILESSICIMGGERAENTCKGDSGGPLQQVEAVNKRPRFVLYGVVSLGPQCNGAELPSIHTRVDDYIDWILNNLKA